MLYSDQKTKLLKELQLPVVIIGMGISGQAVLRLLLASGLRRQDILTFDQNPQQKMNCDLPDLDAVEKSNPGSLVVSPGVPLNLDWIQRFLAQGVQLSSELELASSFLTHEKLIAITGSVGKSTVTSLIGAGLKNSGQSAFVGGNLGRPLADYATALLEGSPSVEWIILELSSYQLENFPSLRPEASILVSLTPNHLERYRGLDHYYETKLSLVSRTRSHVIFNLNGLDLSRYRNHFNSPLHHWVSREDVGKQGFSFERMSLVGDHNRDNISLAVALGKLLHWPESYQEGLLEFRGLPHRLENLGHHHGVLFLNDSKATTIASVEQAVESVSKLIETHRRTWLLLGGKDKSLPWKNLSPLRANSKIHFVFFGEVGAKASLESKLQGEIFPSLRSALDQLFPKLQEQDLVLLSPGGTSLDEFKSFEDRGDFFRKQIERWSADPNRLVKPD